MRADEFRLMCSSLMDGELSQALAHTIAWSQKPENLYYNAQIARIVGGATALHPKDILAVQATSPHCLNGRHCPESNSSQHYEIPGMIKRIKLTMISGNTPWLVETNNRTLDIYTAYQHGKERYHQPYHKGKRL